MQPTFFKQLSLCIVLLSTIVSHAQENLPQDYLSKEFHKGRREAARALMPSNSVMVVFAAPTRTFSNDVDYFYHQNPDLYYFTGYKEPHSVLFIFKEPQTAADGHSYRELFFIQKRNPQAESWTGKRLGVEGVKSQLGINDVFNGEEFAAAQINFSKFDKIIFDNLPDDVVRGTDPGSLYKILAAFREKSGLPSDFDAGVNNFLDQVKNNVTFTRLVQAQDNMKSRMKTMPQFASSKMVNEFLAIKDSAALDAFKDQLEKRKFTTSLFRQITGTLRETKTPEELGLIRKAVEISCMAHNEVMRSVRPDMSELEIQGLQEYVHKRYGAEEVGYGSIVGSGENGCILHYMENTKTRIGNDLLLMDVGAEYHGYTADVTRTIPADGKFSAEERAIYQIVYDAQEAAFKLLKDGAKWADAGVAAKEVIANGLLALGIIRDKKDVNKYYPHGLSHHIGLDVHDKGVSQVLKKDMVITIEPGIYIPGNSDCDKKWWGISVRIEDDALITQDGYELLTSFSPRSIADIEKMIAEKSVLDNYKLPALKSAEKKKAF
jgi:Xaa-Pro aminopeptidase